MSYRRLRWIIVGLLTISTALNYVDRQTLSILSATLRREFQLSESDYANAVTAFLISYTAMYSLAGRWMDRVGLRIGIVVCIAWWSVATMLTAFAYGALSLALCRFLLGIGEPGIYPGGLKACAEWFPRRERALATGLFSSGSALGAILAPPLIVAITLHFGWRFAFVIPGIFGLLWIPFWLRYYRPPEEHPMLSSKDRAMLAMESVSTPGRPWGAMLRERAVWSLLLPRFVGDSVWYFYLFWLPDYLQRERHLSLLEIGFYGWIPFLFADLGNIGGGAASDWLIRRGWEPVKARGVLLAGVGILSPVGALVGIVPQTAIAIAVTCLIACLTQVWSTNTATLAADLFPANERATMMGMMGTAGALGGVFFAQTLAVTISSFGYGGAFMLAAVLHPLAAIILFLLGRGTATAIAFSKTAAAKHAGLVGFLLLGSATLHAADLGSDVRPILAQHCFHCHGPDPATRQAALRLDTREGLFSRPGLVVPGDALKSRLFQRISHENPSRRMPPPQSKKELTASQIATVRNWIDTGAEWREHWSLRRPERPKLPVTRARWGRNPIDAFILARLEQAQLQPEPEAGRRALIRRLSFDLTGLPPSKAETDAFVGDRSPDYYEKAVSRLLDSPHWGEHRARYWLDSARYADTHGLHADNYREIWPYRDWVIQAFNRNLPFDSFTIEQLAGDLLPNPTLSQLTATGFHRCNITTNEGGVIPAEADAMYARDRVETTATVWLGLTLGCAACHDHKYDPLRQQDFYQFAAFFNNTTQKPLDGNIPGTPPTLVIPRDADKLQWEQHTRRASDLRSEIEARIEKLAEPGPAFFPNVPEPLFRLDNGNGVEFDTASGIEAAGAKPFDAGKPFTIATRIKIPEAAESVVASFVGGNGNGPRWVLAIQSMFLQFVLHDPQSGRTLQTKGVSFRLPPGGSADIGVSYNGSGNEGGITLYAGGEALYAGEAHDRYTGWRQTEFRTAMLRLGTDGVRSFEGGAIRSFAVYDSLLSGVQMRVLASGKTARKYAHEAQIDAAFHGKIRELEDLEQTLRAIRRRSVTTLIMEEKPDSPATARILVRGQYDQPGTAMMADVPTIFGATPQRNRLALAQWIVSGENPLTARVIVNRFWQELFGSGLVKTSEDFGATGEPPSHPELLDWLAVDFRESGWNVKRLFRQMVTSAAYRQSASASAAKRQADPENRMVSRGPRFRMDGEMIRDTALKVSGLLTSRIGGPSVKPYQPDGVWESVAVLFSDTRFYRRDAGPNLYRRSLYTFWKRSAPPASMEIFNAPTRESCVVRRERTNTPLQALAAMNDPQIIEASRRLAERALSNPGSNGRLDYITEQVLARRLKAPERAVLRSALELLLARYSAAPGEADALIRTGDRPANRKHAPAQLAAWTMIASTILNLDEALNK